MRLFPYLLMVVAGVSSVGAAVRPAAKPGARPYLLHLNGIGGERACDHSLIAGLRQGGFDAEVEFYDWTGGRIGIEALQGRERHQAEARKIADKMAAYAQAHPRVPIYITGHSGGCGLAVWALELLPDDVKVDHLLLFAPALSPDYDLTRALRHVKHRAYVFPSEYDRVVLGTGTKLFGTIDGQRVEAAGLIGFTRPNDADATEYGKLVSYPYRASWLARYGSAGGHIGTLRTRFARDYVATLLLTGSPPAEVDDAGPTTRPSVPAAVLP